MKKVFILSGFMLSACFVSGQGVAIGDRDFTPNSAAILDVSARNKGVLVPRMTYTERMYIQTNAQSVGLLVFQTDRDAGFYYWDGLAWKYLAPQQATDLPKVLATVATTGDYEDLLNKPRLRDLEQDELYFTTVSQAERNYWNGKANVGDIPTRLQDLEQNDLYFTTVSRAERDAWNAKVSADNEKLFDERVPKGNAGGDLTDKYPNPKIKSDVDLKGMPKASEAAIPITSIGAFIQDVASMNYGSNIVNVQTLINALTALVAESQLPVGSVIMWHGNVANVPCGWRVMNEFYDRFPVGAGSTYQVGSTGGEALHTLTIDEIPSHNHSLFLVGSGTRFTGRGDADELNSGDGSTGDTGGDAAHENRPPYYGIYFIEKVSLCLN